jgi:hypothetical protein
MDKTAYANIALLGSLGNAVRIQIYTEIIAYCLVIIVGNDLKINRSIYEILQVLGKSIPDKTPVHELFTSLDYNDVNLLDYNQLLFS